MSGVKQFSMNAEDRVGALAELTKDLAYQGVNIQGIFVVATAEGGRIRFIVDDSVKAERVLHEEKLSYEMASVLAVEVTNAPGALHEVAQALAEARVSIEYAYTLLPLRPKAVVVLKVADVDGAAEVLRRKGVEILEESDL